MVLKIFQTSVVVRTDHLKLLVWFEDKYSVADIFLSSFEISSLYPHLCSETVARPLKLHNTIILSNKHPVNNQALLNFC